MKTSCKKMQSLRIFFCYCFEYEIFIKFVFGNTIFKKIKKGGSLVDKQINCFRDEINIV